MEAVVQLCEGDRALQVLAAYESAKRESEVFEVIRKAAVDAFGNFPESCKRSEMARPGQPTRFEVKHDRIYVSISVSAGSSYILAERH